MATRKPKDVLALLKEQHKEVDELMESLESSRSASKRKSLFEQLADRLAAHATMEEKIFYPAVKAKKTEEMLLESTEEHLSVKRVLADMLSLDVDDDRFDAKLSVLKEQVSHHAHKEEEKVLFPKVREMMSKEELQELGVKCEALFTELLRRSPRKNVPSETEHAASV